MSYVNLHPFAAFAFAITLPTVATITQLLTATPASKKAAEERKYLRKSLDVNIH